ncbi:MAG: DUF1416 domain-containing protein [Candidatus Dormibacteria bacterium]
MTYVGCTQAPADYRGETTVTGVVRKGAVPFEGAYVRLRGSRDEFVAEIRTGKSGRFQFFPVAGTWTVVVLAPGEVRDETSVTVGRGEAAELEFDVTPALTAGA